MPNSVIDFPWIPAHVTETVLVRTGKSVLHTIAVNELSATVTVYDGVDAGGSIIAVITTDLSQPVTLTYDCKCDVGIYITLVGQGTCDLTVNYT